MPRTTKQNNSYAEFKIISWFNEKHFLLAKAGSLEAFLL